ncbi:hypothetical protein [Terribacillus saccharophilus]|uniref:hypothetical protein n=1 Tax=Terribacillus saccharophilus TaxID=361277 RepID=UPI003D2E06DD
MSENKTKVPDLSFFLPNVVEEVEEVTSPISKRFKDKEGNIVKWIPPQAILDGSIKQFMKVPDTIVNVGALFK